MDAVAEEDDLLLEVKFYTGDEEIPEQHRQQHYTEGYKKDDQDQITKISSKPSKLWTGKGTSFSKSTESEDSGVKSVSSSDDHSSKRFAFGLRRQQSTLRSMPSAPLFDFPTFDELFQSHGEFSLSFHDDQTVDSQRTVPNFGKHIEMSPTESDKVFEDEEITEMETSPERQNTSPRRLVRQDSIMVQNISEMIYKSWEGSKGFTGFRHKLGNNIRHKYCMCCRLHSTIFIFMYAVFGVFLTCAGTMCFVQCHSEIMMSVYLIVDGLLSVFVFPIILMDWTTQIGGCVSEKHKSGTGAFWPITLILRVTMVIAGTFVVIFRYYVQERIWSNDVCKIEFYVAFSAIVIEWIFLCFAVVVPILVYAVVYFFAPGCL